MKKFCIIIFMCFVGLLVASCGNDADKKDENAVSSDATKNKDADKKDEDKKDEDKKDEDKKDKDKKEDNIEKKKDKKEDKKDSKSNDKTNKKSSKVADDLYDKFIKDVTKACNNGMTDEDLNKFGLSDVFSIDAKFLGYAKIDLDGDGSDELIFGNKEEDGKNTVFNIYTIVNNKIKIVASGGQRNTYSICEDNIIKNNGSNSATSGVVYFYKLSKGNLKFQEGLIFDGEKNEKKPWFYTKKEKNKNPKNISDEEQSKIEKKYKIKKIDFAKFMK